MIRTLIGAAAAVALITSTADGAPLPKPGDCIGYDSAGRCDAVAETADRVPTPDPAELQRLKKIDDLIRVQLGGKFYRGVDSLAPADYSPQRLQYFDLCRKARTHATIGMTVAQVRATDWCYPDKQNTTITARGKHVQEVYPYGYLYFENGVLTTIQTR